MSITGPIYLYKAGVMHRLVVAAVGVADTSRYPLTAQSLEDIRQYAASTVAISMTSMPAIDLGLRMFRPGAIKRRIETLSHEITNAIVREAKQRSGSIDTYGEFCIIMVRLSQKILEALPYTGPVSNWDDRNEYSYLSKSKHGSAISQHERSELDDNRRSTSFEMVRYIGQQDLTATERQEFGEVAKLLTAKYQEILTRIA